jgi:hypothetical protein
MSEAVRSKVACEKIARRRQNLRQIRDIKGPLCRRHFFSSSAQFVTTVTDWLTCCEITLRSIFLPSGATS